MKNIFKLSLIAFIITVVLIGCEKKEVQTPSELLEGKWTISSSELLATEIPGDGSYLVFNACSNICTGTDYMASDSSSGTFDYILNESATEIIIEDTLRAGGVYGYTWDILELSETDFRITASTFLGNLKIEMVKD